MSLAEVAPVRLHVPARTLVLVAGLPGAGKSTLLATLPPDPTTVVLDSEDTRDRLSARLPARTPYPAFSGHAARAGSVAESLRGGPPPGWASARVVDRACARRGLALDK